MGDQKELMKVIQRNFRKYFSLRTWGWFIIIQKTRPLIGQINLEDELRILEEKANDAYGAYEQQLNTKARLEEDIVTIKVEREALVKQIEAEQGTLSQYHDKQARMTAQKDSAEKALVVAGEKLITMEANRQQATADKKALEGENVVIKKDMEDLELAIQKLEQEKTNRDHQIRSLNDEIANQDEVINKLNKEKKHAGETSSKASEDLQAVEDKVSHMNNIKSKLEQTLDELQDSLEREKRARADIDKNRRKVEGELKVTQDTVSDLERVKKESENTIARKEKDLSALSSKLDDEQSLVAKTQKAIKEVQGRVEELEEELEAERQARAKAERQRSDLARELEQLGERLGEAGGATAAQVDLNKKREAEINKLRRDLEEANIQHEGILVGLKKKHVDATSEMSEQVDQLNKMKQKVEKEKHAKKLQIDEIMAAIDIIANEKASLEKQNTLLQHQLSDVNRRCGEASLTLSDYDNARKKTVVENVELLRNVEE